MELGLGLETQDAAGAAEQPAPAAAEADAPIESEADAAPGADATMGEEGAPAAATAKPARLDAALSTSREPDVTLPWSIRKKMMSTVAVPTFACGIDYMAPEETEKRSTRGARFGTAEDQAAAEEEKEKQRQREQRAARFGVTVATSTPGGQ